VSSIPPLALLLFGQSFSECAKSTVRSKVIVDGWIHLRISEVHAAMARKIKREINDLLGVVVSNTDDGNSSNIHSNNSSRERQEILTEAMEKLLRLTCAIVENDWMRMILVLNTLNYIKQYSSLSLHYHITADATITEQIVVALWKVAKSVNFDVADRKKVERLFFWESLK
jgi:hypothetical protein